MHAALGRGFSAFLNCHECYVLSSFLQQILQRAERPCSIARRVLHLAARRVSSAPDRRSAADAAPRPAGPTTILPRPVRASSPGRLPSHKSRAASPPRLRRGCRQTRSYCCLRRRTRILAGNAGTTIAVSLRSRPSRRPFLQPTSRMRTSHARTRSHPPVSPVSEASHRAGRRAPTPLHRPPGARNRLGQASPVPWAAYNRARSKPCQNQSGASRCF